MKTYTYTGLPCRLDKAVESFLPHMGLRGRRRLIKNGLVLIKGQTRAISYIVQAGTHITFCSPTEQPSQDQTAHYHTNLQATACASTDGSSLYTDQARYLEQQDDYCFFFKPAGLHTVSLQGGIEKSLESQIPQLIKQNIPTLATDDTTNLTSQHPVLLQRLDYHTSGIIVAALQPHLVTAWRTDETHGLCHKRYLALLCGYLPKACLVTAALDTKQRKRTRVLDYEATPLRHTHFTPLAYFSGSQATSLQATLMPSNRPTPSFTLAGCTIHKGARHQIRVHAASLDLPLWGDALYNNCACDEHFFLHHGSITFQNHHLVLPPKWLAALPPTIGQAALHWLAQK